MEVTLNVPSNGFALRYADVERLVQHRRFGTAYEQALKLMEDFPEEIGAYFLFNLARCCCNRTDSLTADAIRTKADEYPNATPSIVGDMMRDLAIALIRQRKLAMAHEIIREVRKLHDGDSNRVACLIGVEGRLEYARGNTALAISKHEEADARWTGMGDRADKVWQYNNLVHLLKALVRHKGLRDIRVTFTDARIKHECPPGSKNRHGEAVLITALPGTNRLDDLLRRYWR